MADTRIIFDTGANAAGGTDQTPVSRIFRFPVEIGASSATATLANIASAAADTQILAANASRKPGSVIVNDSTAVLYVKLGTGASPTSYTVAIDGKTTVAGVYAVPDGYQGAVNGYWVSANGFARATEMQ